MKKKLFTLFVLLSLLAFSHPGRTDASGGHRDRKNGGYHYHQIIRLCLKQKLKRI